jgi:Protein of unknown function (DUF2867)
MPYLTKLASVQNILIESDHFDEKVIEADVSLREFIAGFLGYYPFWIKALYNIRAIFVRLLGMKQDNMTMPRLTPETIPFTAGEMATFFEVAEGTDESVWIAKAIDEHLTAYVIIAVDPLRNGLNRFYVGTIVHYHKWTGPVYFNIIRPFHHIVVQSMMKSGTRYKQKPAFATGKK